MFVLVACEFSGIVRDAFRERGYRAYSCDFLETESPSKYHLRCDVRRVLGWGWDLMIAHPPCSHLSLSGARWFKHKEEEQRKSLSFVQTLLDAPIPKAALENPVGVISTRIRKPDQIIHPWWFGHREKKRTCLWLKNLPRLKPTKVVTNPVSRVLNESESPARWKNRSRTLTGIASAMADQWGKLLP